MRRVWYSPMRIAVALTALIAAAAPLGLAAAAIRDQVREDSTADATRMATEAVRYMDTTLRDPHTGPDSRTLINAWTDETGSRAMWAILVVREKQLVAASGAMQQLLDDGLDLPIGITASPQRPATIDVRLDAGTPCQHFECGLRGRVLTMVTAQVLGGAVTEPLQIFVLSSPYVVDSALATVDRVLWVALPLALVLVALAAWHLVGRVLRPVEAIRRQLEHITANDLRRRVPVPRSRDEIHRLAVTTNETLDRLDTAIGRQRQFVADAAHELRSPIATLINTLEVAGADPDPTRWSEVAEVALRQARRLQMLADDLLLLARLDRALPLPDRIVDLGALAAEQVAERRVANHSGPSFSVDAAPDARVSGDEASLGRLVRNLLDNAAAHGRHAVAVSVERQPTGHITLEVADDGPGIPPAQREQVFQRFARLDRARARDHGGTGLGLAIARDIAAQHHGTLTVADSTDGARLVLRIPAAAVQSAASSHPR